MGEQDHIDKPGTETVEVPALEASAAPEPDKAAPPEAPKKPRTKRRSTAMFVGGIVAASFGAPMTAGGVIGIAGCGEGELKDCTQEGAVGLTVVGALVLGGGIALTLHGRERLHDNSAPKKASAVPLVTVGLGSASLRWDF
ncbi:hypothetical protein [Sorangium sp. So ce1078]|uniref:hypothetical protein n=1 Tax=Sorangium sp. So ce1078 TaxID=3133329 RepID=UPI003F62FE80